MKSNENNPASSNANTSRLRAPTSLKRNMPVPNNASKIPKLNSEPLTKELENKDASVMRSTTFTVPNKIPLRQPPKPVTKPNTTSTTRTVVTRGVNTTMPAKPLENKPRPKWDLRSRLTDLEAAYNEKVASADKKIEELETECNKLSEDLKVCNETISELENIRDTLTNEKADLVISVNNLIQQTDQMKEEISRTTIQINELVTEKESISKLNNDLNQSLNLSQQKCHQLEDECKLKHTEIDSIKAQLDQLKLESERQKTQIESLTQQLHQKNTELEEVNKMFYDLKKIKYDMGLELDLKRSNLDNLTVRYESLLRSSEEENRNYEKISAQYAVLKNDKENLVHNLDRDGKRLVEITAELDKLRITHNEDVQNIMDLQKQIYELTANRDSIQSNLNFTGSEVAALRRDLEACRKQLGQADVDRRLMHHKFMELRGTIRVCCRVRPVLSSESNPSYMIEIRSSDNTLVISSKNGRETVTGDKTESKRYDFAFDRLFSQNCTQSDVFDEIEPLIQSALDGYSVCIFAYGQTGSGKTYTMEGDLTNPDKVGLIQRSVNKIFDSMPINASKGWIYKIEASFLEIYNETIKDLLISDSTNSHPKLDIKTVQNDSKKNSTEVDVFVPDLTTVKVTNAQEVKKLLFTANRNRTVAATKCNDLSSRSHSVFRLKLIGQNDGLSETTEAVINLVDLAGSERLSQSGAENERLKETQYINKSLSTLRTVITSLHNKESHIPYRDSKLTRLLQSSLGGNCKALMFVNISPLEDNFNESLTSLRFASTVNKCFIGTATKNKVSSNH